MFVPTNELVLAELDSAMGANDRAESNILRMVDIPFSDILPIAGDDEVLLTEVRRDNFSTNDYGDIADNFSASMSVCLSSIREWDGTMDANL